MAGLNKYLKQADKMKLGLAALRTQLEAARLDVEGAGGAVKITVSATGQMTSLSLAPEFLKQDPAQVAAAILATVNDAAQRAREHSEAEMKKITAPAQPRG